MNADRQYARFVDWEPCAWRVWAIDRGTVIAALSFCATLDGVA
jgi:hypothetical protein